MSVVASRVNQHVKPESLPILAADVGGTHARVALVRATTDRGHAFEVLAYQKFSCADFAGLPDLLQTFIDAEATAPVRRCVVACAGQVMGDTIVNDNLVWPVTPSELRVALQFDDVAWLNDFEALGYALDDVRSDGSLLLCGPDVHADGAAVVVGPGTGLGAAVRLPGPAGTLVLATEAGQMDFAPCTAREREVLARLVPGDGYVPYERILSGPGLLTLYSALCGLRGRAPELASPEAVTAAACAGADADAVETVDLFCAVLGAFVGNLAMAYMADGGVYLAGGVLPKMRTLLQNSRFVPRFLNKGGMQTYLRRVPVRLIEHGRHGVLGAARWYFEMHARDPVRGRGMRDGTAA